MINLVPDLDRTITDFNFEMWQAYAFAFEIYILDGMLLALFALLCCNIWMVLIKNSGYRVLPLVLFYALSVCLVVCRMFFFTFQFSWEHSVLAMQLAEVANFMKLELGLIQILIFIELSIKLRVCIDLYMHDSRDENGRFNSLNETLYEREIEVTSERWIRFCQVFFSSLICLVTGGLAYSLTHIDTNVAVIPPFLTMIMLVSLPTLLICLTTAVVVLQKLINRYKTCVG